ncbi:MAG TPA: DUF3127 domain-containing protein [Bacteroidales bacterium]|nr:DUF3127 domain-containing protein [Bacteroidales bacterium]
MEIIGKFLKALPEQTGESARGAWVRGGFVIETEEQYPKQLAFSLWGEDKVAIVRTMSPNTQLKVYFNPESREYNDRWYTDLKCFRIDTFNPLTLGSPQPNQDFSQPSASPAPVAQPSSPQKEEYGSFNSTEPQEDDDLPF